MKNFLIRSGASLALVAARPVVRMLIILKHEQHPEMMLRGIVSRCVYDATRKFTQLAPLKWLKNIMD